MRGSNCGKSAARGCEQLVPCTSERQARGVSQARLDERQANGKHECITNRIPVPIRDVTGAASRLAVHGASPSIPPFPGPPSMYFERLPLNE